MSLFTMQVGCDCSHQEIIGMDAEGAYQLDYDKTKCYAWLCPKCNRRTLVRLNFLGEDE